MKAQKFQEDLLRPHNFTSEGDVGMYGDNSNPGHANNQGYGAQGNMGYGAQGNMGYGAQGNMGYENQPNMGYGNQGNMGYVNPQANNFANQTNTSHTPVAVPYANNNRTSSGQSGGQFGTTGSITVQPIGASNRPPVASDGCCIIM